ncbi:RHS domain-containing protein [Xanthomonas protegens]|uniref:RHS domain-containing protein n=1 Tax=Xanthomonas protegens TaxID=3380705 RepID=A0ABU9LDE3_9XANT
MSWIGLLWVLVLALPVQALVETVEYFHTDALGTPIAVTDASGKLIETSEYEPYGKLLNRPVTDGPGFTGHVQDAATGLTYMQQRYYDPVIGRFLSVDPVAAIRDFVALFNRYKYSNDNPYRFSDPNGMCTGTHVCNEDGTAVSTSEYTTMAGTALMPKTITSSMVSSVGPEQASKKQIDTAVKDANSVGRTAKAAGDSRAVRAFNKLDGIEIDSSNWDVSTAQGGTVEQTSVAYVNFNSKSDRGSIVLSAARYFDGRSTFYRVFRFMHEVFHFDTEFDNQKITQLAAGCVGWNCQFERNVEAAARKTMNAGWDNNSKEN